MPLDPMTILMFGLIAVLIFFMFRNGKKRKEQMETLQNNMQPGVEVMTQSGIFGTISDVDDEANRVTIVSGNSSLVVHRNAISQIITPVDVAEPESTVAPDDDPAFDERVSGERAESIDETPNDVAEPGSQDDDQSPKA